ncbi:MAG: transposase zinc-binding domain-containing protein [Myxococcales bacterium]|nr:transposase zinc-binding domain-containing protein [Myxococcales bacterium]
MVDRAAGKVSGYRRREPETTQLYRLVQDTWLTFRDNLQGEGGFLPAFVAAEFEAYLGCGILGKGFVNVRCEACAETRVVAFSCKRRGFCPSCLGRRMGETAAHVVDNVFPAVPARQWVLTVPHALRYRMAREPHLASVVLRVFLREVSRWYRKRARKAGVRGGTRIGRRDGDPALRLRPCAERSLSFRSDRRRVPCRHARSARVLRHATSAR